MELSITDAIEIAQQKNPITAVSQFEISQAKEDINEIFGTFHSPQFEILSYGGLISDARGNATESPDSVEDYSHLGPFFKADIKIIQPLYSFGKYGTALEAGQQNLEMKKSMHRKSVTDLSFEVTKAFLGVVAGQSGNKAATELKKQYRALLEQVTRLSDDPDGEIDISYLLEAKTLLYEIEKQSTKPQAIRDQSLLYLKGLLNKKQDSQIIALATETPELEQSTDLLPKLLDYSRSHSPLQQSLSSALTALEKKYELEKKKTFPDLFVALGAGYGIAPDREKQINPFISDDYNYEKIGAVMGLKWNFNFHNSSAKEQKALLEYYKIMQKKKLVMVQLDGNIRKYYSEAIRYQKLLAAAQKSFKAAKSWLRLENDNMDLGIGDLKRFISASQSYYTLQSDEINARYTYLLSLAQLSKTMGDMNLFLQWINNGKVQLQ